MRLFFAAILILVISCCAFGQTYTISTVAGGAPPTTPAAAVTLSISQPADVAADTSGNVYFTSSNCVFKLDQNGVLTRIAGNSSAGYSGDGGLATSAQLNNPYGLTVDGAGNLFIADEGNYRVRKVSTNGVIATVAGNGTGGFSGDGGPATNAQFGGPAGALAGGPYGVAVDGAGNLFITDASNSRVRKVATSGIITTVAGTGTLGFSGDGGPATNAKLYYPFGVAVDGAGDLFIADEGNWRVRKVSTNGIITTVAGNGSLPSGSFSGDGGPAANTPMNPFGVTVDGVGNLFVDEDTRVRRVSADGIITTVAGSIIGGFSGDGGPATSAQLGTRVGVGMSLGLHGMAIDSSGNLFIADAYNNRVREVSARGIITTVVGNGTASFSGDGGLATNAQLNLPGSFDTYASVAVDGAGNLFIADEGNYRVRKVSTNGIITTVAGNGTLGYSGEGGPATNAQLGGPVGVAADSAGNLFIADAYNCRVLKVSTGGIISRVAGNGAFGGLAQGFSGDGGPATNAKLSNPSGVAVDGAGNIFIGDSGNNRVRKVSTSGIITTVAGNGTNAGYYDDSGDGGLATNAQVTSPANLAVDSAGDIFIAWNKRVRKVSTNGIITTVAGSSAALSSQGLGFSGDGGPATNAELSHPAGVAVGSAGDLFIADTGNLRVRRVSTNGIITTVAGNGTPGFFGDGGPATNAQLNYPFGVAMGSAGNLYIADYWNDRIRVLTPSAASCSASVTPVALSPAATGGSFTVTVQTGSSCGWAVLSLPDWITVVGSAAGTGPGNVTLSVAANPGGSRTATVSIAGVSVAVTQQAAPLSISAVTNAASNLPGAISPGEIVVLYGSGIGPAQLVKAAPGSDGSYGTQLANTGVSFNGIAAPMIYAWAGQTAAIVPYGVTGANAQVTVTYQGQTSAAFSVSMASSAPGIFTYDSTGQGPAAAINQDGITVNTAATPTRIGDIISLYATGEGQTTPVGLDGKPASVPYPYPNLPVTVTVGGQGAPVKYAGGAPGLVAGLMQVNVQIPAGIQTGNAVPVALKVGSVFSQGGITIAVR